MPLYEASTSLWRACHSSSTPTWMVMPQARSQSARRVAAATAQKKSARDRAGSGVAAMPHSIITGCHEPRNARHRAEHRPPGPERQSRVRLGMGRASRQAGVGCPPARGRRLGRGAPARRLRTLARRRGKGASRTRGCASERFHRDRLREELGQREDAARSRFRRRYAQRRGRDLASRTSLREDAQAPHGFLAREIGVAAPEARRPRGNPAPRQGAGPRGSTHRLRLHLSRAAASSRGLARRKADFTGAPLVITAHDYFAVCPSFVLLNADGAYCGIPEISVCASCLKRHEASFVALSPPTQMGAWRALWGRCLAAADEVRCFSEASRKLFVRAYPDLDPARLTVIPHAVDFVPARKPHVNPAAPLVIGVVGEISIQKGAHVVEEVIARIERESLDARVVLLGLLHSARQSPRLKVTGPYKREDLADLVESNGVNMLFFPSIWPETFSYVVGEMMAMELPIVAFDIGAPAERLRSYSLGRLCAEANGAAALDQVIALHRELSQQKASA